MLKNFFYLLEKLSDNKTFLSFFVRKLFKDSNLISIKRMIELNSSSRPAYVYCAYNSALLAKKLGYKKLSFIEFGVAEGNGLTYLEKIALRIEKELDIEIEIYGFDTGQGLVEPKDYKDLSYFFETGMYKMNQEKLLQKLKKAKLVLGDVKNTASDFCKKNNPAPIGAIFNDLDFYSSTVDSFKLFDSEDKFFLPRVFCYFDDVIGSEDEMYNDFTGELLAINEFNDNNNEKKISLNKNLMSLSNQSWKNQIYHLHSFDHPHYNNYIGGSEQKKINKSIKYKY